MDDFEPPSFSLGFDLDLDPEPQPAPPPPGASTGNNFSAAAALGSNADEDDDFETPPMVPNSQLPETTSTFKRLRRGPALKVEKRKPKEEGKFSVDDDIEDFSSQEDQPPDDFSMPHYSVCSSSKLPLNGQGPRAFLSSQSAKELTDTKRTNTTSSSASTYKEAIGNRLVFPELHVSPLRRFKLIESDSDEASPCQGPNEIINKVNLPSKDGKFTVGQVETTGQLKKTKAPDIMSQDDDLWKEIHSNGSFHIPTPALDEFCEEYARSVKDKTESKFENGYYASSNLRKDDMQQIASGSPHPSYHYYYHEDSRIQKLVRDRLPLFFPLCCGNNQGSKQPNASTINYMSQFNQGEASKQGKKNQSSGPSSTKPRKSSGKSTVVDEQEESGGWISPRVSGKTPKDVGKKRVSGDCKSTGHWYTAGNGRRVYVAGNGQEMTGQFAYRQYKRDSGGFKRSNKKAASKKRPAKKKK